MREGTINKHPSTAKIVGTEYVPDPLNQPLAVAQAEGKFGAQPLGDHQHPNGTGYCRAHRKLGCTECKQAPKSGA